MTRAWWALMAAMLVGCPPPEFSGDPALTVGTGEFAYEDVTEGQFVEIGAGPQGGHHIWFGVRATGLDPRQLRLDSQLYFAPQDSEEETLEGESFFFFPAMFEGDEPGLWETAGLIHQVDRGEVANRRFRLVVTATDRDGRTAEGSMIVVPVRGQLPSR